MKSVLDSWAVIALLSGEGAAEEVRCAIEDGAFISWVNLSEVLYVESRRVGSERATTAVESLAAQVVAELPDGALFFEAAAVKAEGGVAFADAFAIATAERKGLPLLTGDPEILSCNRPDLKAIDLRR
jgi:predicted nucleic acid-binding protein